MDRVFSVDDISDHFWPTPTLPPPPPIPAPDPAKEDLRMSRSASEWALQMFLQETATSPLSDTTSSSKSVAVNDLVVTKDEVRRKNLQNKQVVNRKTGGAPPSNIIPVDSEDYQDFLKSRLDLACAAVALKKAPYVIGQGSAGAADSTSQGSADSLSVTQAPGKALQSKDVGGPMGNPSLSAGAKKVVAQIKSNVSGSSRELSDDDNDDEAEAEGENETTGNRDPTAAKRVRRMLSNRESARRSRRRKQAHLSDLETQVSQLKVENSSLAKRLTDISHKFNEAAVDNRVLKADIETLRAKVKMAEETVKRVTNISPLLQAMSEIPTIRAQTFSGSPSDSADSAVPVHNPKQQLYRPPLQSLNPTPRAETVATAEIASTENALPNPPASTAGANKIGRTASMQRVASLEHLQKRICGGINQSSSDP